MVTGPGGTGVKAGRDALPSWPAPRSSRADWHLSRRRLRLCRIKPKQHELAQRRQFTFDEMPKAIGRDALPVIVGQADLPSIRCG